MIDENNNSLGLVKRYNGVYFNKYLTKINEIYFADC